MRREGAWWGTPRKRALFGPEEPNGISSGSDGAEAQVGWPPDKEYPTVASPGGHMRTHGLRRWNWWTW